MAGLWRLSMDAAWIQLSVAAVVMATLDNEVDDALILPALSTRLKDWPSFFQRTVPLLPVPRPEAGTKLLCSSSAVQLSVERSLMFSGAAHAAAAPAAAPVVVVVVVVDVVVVVELLLWLLLAKTAPMRLFSLTDFSADEPWIQSIDSIQLS